MGSGADMNDFNASPMLDEEEVKAERSDSGSSDEAPEKNENKMEAAEAETDLKTDITTIKKEEWSHCKLAGSVR